MINRKNRPSVAEQKAKIRERYRGMDTDNMEVIPARKAPDFYDEEPKRVAVYVRVSTDDPRQTTSFEIQKNYYEDLVEKHELWTLVDIYADEGISGTSLQHRDAFNQMIADCRAGKIDLIITKSVSRFARNILDCIGMVRDLSALNPPVGVFFETEHIFTLKDDTEMSLSFQATMAQEESHTKSRIMNTSIEMRFSHGILLTPELFGYKHDEEGNLTINEEQAPIVRLVFFMYLYGYTCQQIANTLTQLGIKTMRGKEEWSAGTVLGILRNERHCGEVLTRKTYTPNYLNHKAKKNMGDRTQHRWRDHHEPIISRDDFIAVQHLINNAKYGNKGILPELHVVPDGALKGFVSINPRWSGFKAEDYLLASQSVLPEADEEVELEEAPIQITANTGDFDLRGFEIARSQFFDTQDKLCVTFSDSTILFSTACIRKFKNAQYIEMLIHPSEHLLAIRVCDQKHRNAMKWAKLTNDGEYIPRGISGAAFLGTLYQLFDWDKSFKYRIRGIRRQKDDAAILVFDLKETELFVPKDTVEAETENEATPIKHGRTVVAYPSAWADNFGSNYYIHAQASEMAAFAGEDRWQGDGEIHRIAALPDLNVTTQDVAAAHIKKIIKDIQEDTQHGDGTSTND